MFPQQCFTSPVSVSLLLICNVFTWCCVCSKRLLVSLDYLSTCSVRPILRVWTNDWAHERACMFMFIMHHITLPALAHISSIFIRILVIADTQHNSVDAEILYLAASWIWEEYKFILIVLIKRKYPFSLYFNWREEKKWCHTHPKNVYMDWMHLKLSRDLWNMNISSHYELDDLEKLQLSFR